jgi:hypothetical protein
MVSPTKCVDYSEPVEVKLCSDKRGAVSIGIRINGSNLLVLSSGVTMPSPGRCRTWSKTIGDVMKAPPSLHP